MECSLPDASADKSGRTSVWVRDAMRCEWLSTTLLAGQAGLRLITETHLPDGWYEPAKSCILPRMHPIFKSTEPEASKLLLALVEGRRLRKTF